ncbi:MAG TPA: hypothetical protein VKJ83_01280, partial [Actinomycetota bacterium]|nr:hypothetical protein [Actinomycetota bacterium]
MSIPAWASVAQAGGSTDGKVAVKADMVSARVVVHSGPGTTCTWRVVTNLTVSNLDSRPTQITGVTGSLKGTPPDWPGEGQGGKQLNAGSPPPGNGPGSDPANGQAGTTPDAGTAAQPQKATLYAVRTPPTTAPADNTSDAKAATTRGTIPGDRATGVPSSTNGLPPGTGNGASQTNTQYGGVPQPSAGNGVKGLGSGSSGARSASDSSGDHDQTKAGSAHYGSPGHHNDVDVEDNRGVGTGTVLGPNERHTYSKFTLLVNVSCSASSADVHVFVASPAGTHSCKVPFLATASAVPVGSLG